jgi:hypothetical protein
MDILTLELFDVTVSQALTELSHALEQHPDLPLRVILNGEETLLHNLLRFLERQQRKATSTPMGSRWQLDVEPRSKAAPPLQPIPAPVIAPAVSARPLLLLRSAFVPGDRALGRHLLLGTLRAVEPPTPWLALAHEALELLEDPQALEVLAGLRASGVPVRISRESLAFMRLEPGPFESMDDREWQSLAARGALTLL